MIALQRSKQWRRDVYEPRRTISYQSWQPVLIMLSCRNEAGTERIIQDVLKCCQELAEATDYDTLESIVPHVATNTAIPVVAQSEHA